MRCALALFLVLLLPSTACAAGWSASMPISKVAGRWPQATQAVAGNARGDALIAWELRGKIYMTRRVAGGPFSAPVVVGSGNRISVAMNDAGAWVTAWTGGGMLNGQPFTIPSSGC